MTALCSVKSSIYEDFLLIKCESVGIARELMLDEFLELLHELYLELLLKSFKISNFLQLLTN